MSENGTEFGCIGRIVWGHPGKQVPVRDQRTNQPLLNDQGQPRMATQFGVAIAKSAAMQAMGETPQNIQANAFDLAVWPLMAAEIATGYPHGVPQGFSYKYKDGDTAVDRQGKPYREREGYAGCIVLNFSSELPNPPPLYKFEGNQYRQLGADELKCGDYVYVKGTFKVNIPKNSTHTPGIYVNPTVVELVGYGKEIVGQGGVDPMQALGGQQRAMPVGASAMPVGGAPAGHGMPGQPMQAPQMAQPGYPQQPQPGYAPQPAPAPVGQPMVAPMAQAGYGAPQPMQAPQMVQPGLPPPAHDYVQQTAGYTPPQAPGMPGQPMQAPQMAQPGYPQQPQPGYAPQPAPAPVGQPMGGMPGMPGPR